MFDLLVVAQLVAFNGLNHYGPRGLACCGMWAHFRGRCTLIPRLRQRNNLSLLSNAEPVKLLLHSR